MINITIQSQNEKVIDIIDINTFSKINSISNNQSISLDYNNLLLDIKTTTSTINLNNLWSNIDKLTQDIIFIFLILIILVCIFYGFKIIKTL